MRGWTHRHNKMRLPAATASSSPLEWKAMQETTKSKWWRPGWCERGKCCEDAVEMPPVRGRGATVRGCGAPGGPWRAVGLAGKRVAARSGPLRL